MQNIKAFELPEELQQVLKKAKKLEWLTCFYILSVVVAMYLTMGLSQAMKVAWLEDALSLLPSLFFLLASRIYDRPPDITFPYGYHRVFSIAFLAGSLALFAMGCFLLIDSGITLVKAEHPEITNVQIFGYQIWMGWIMILVLIYSGAPAVVLGNKKLPLAKQLHNKLLYTDAETQQADYKTAFAAIIGILGVGYGIWWADAVSALIISVSVLYDGFTQMKTAVLDLMDRHPVHIDSREKDELVKEIENFVCSWPWVKDARVRFREHGQIYFGEVFVIPNASVDVVNEIESSLKKLKNFHWKVYDVVIAPVEELPSRSKQ